MAELVPNGLLQILLIRGRLLGRSALKHLHLLERHLLAVAELRVVVDQILGLLYEVAKDGLQFQDTGRVTRAQQLHHCAKVKLIDVREGLIDNCGLGGRYRRLSRS